MDFYTTFLNLSYKISTLLENGIVYFLAVIAGFFIATKILIFLIENVVLLFTRKTKTDIDDKIIDVSKNPVLSLVMLYGFQLALKPFLDSDNGTAQTIDKLLITIGIFVTVALINRIFSILIKFWADHFERVSKVDIKHDLLPLLSKIIKLFIFFIGVIIALSVWGVEIGPLIASLGVAGIILGLALQDSLSNIFSGISLILDKTYKVNDIIVLDTGESGLVYDIGLRSTRIKSWDNEILTIPNKKMANAVIKNLNKPDLAIKTTINFGVEYGSDPEDVKDLVTKAINKIKTVSKEEGRETIVRFMEFGPSSLNFVAMFWVDNIADKWETHQKVMKTIYETLKKADIGIPFPITTVYLDEQKKAKKRPIKKK